jgi:hypothetical protein
LTGLVAVIGMDFYPTRPHRPFSQWNRLDGDYAGSIEKIITTEIKPAVQSFRNKLRTIDESLFGAVAKGLVGAAGGSSALTLFGDLSWPKILALTGAGAAYAAKATIDAILAETRGQKRMQHFLYPLFGCVNGDEFLLARAPGLPLAGRSASKRPPHCPPMDLLLVLKMKFLAKIFAL